MENQLPYKPNLYHCKWTKAIPLGKLFEVPVRFGKVTIPVDMIVIQTITYEIILGNEWLKKAHAIVDLNGEKMKGSRPTNGYDKTENVHFVRKGYTVQKCHMTAHGSYELKSLSNNFGKRYS